MNLAILERVYRNVPIPLRARRIMVAISNGINTRAELHRASKRSLDPTEGEINYLVVYLISRELLREVVIGSEKVLRLVPTCQRSERAKVFDRGERAIQRKRDNEENRNRHNHPSRRQR